MPIFVHGFSVGAYLWGEALLQLGADHPVLKQIHGQVWDSTADFTRMHIGLPHSLFPNNVLARKTLGAYIQLHMKMFYYSSVVHYEKSKRNFSDGALSVPVLMFCSKDDLVGAIECQEILRDDFKRAGLDVNWKCWDHSPHVSHLKFHPEEYMQLLNDFLKKVNFPPVPKSRL